MLRRFIELDGNVHNVGDRIISDYTGNFGSCHSNVGSYATERLKAKLELPQMKPLGFTENILTKSLGTVEVSDGDGLYAIVRELDRCIILLGDTYDDKYATTTERYEGLKEHKTSIVNRYDIDLNQYVKDVNEAWRNKMEAAGTPVEKDFWGWDRTIGTPYMEIFWGDVDFLYTNTPDKKTLGMKPSRFIRKYIEPLIPGISDRYSAALSNTKTLEVHLTIDPNIMLNCSEAATFSSCYRFEGEYHYSAQRFMNGDDVLMAVVFDADGRIMYRNWVLVAPDSKSVITFRAYSSLDTNIIGKPIKQLVRSSILGTPDYTFEREADSWVDIECNSATYLDHYSLATLHDLEGDDDGYVWGDLCSILGEAICIEGGHETDEEQIYGESCDCCEEHTRDGLNEVEGAWVCDYCYNENYVECNRYYRVHNEDVIENVHGEYFHEDDIDDDHTYINGEYYPNDEVTEAVDTGEYHPTDDLTYSDVMQEWYYSIERLHEDEAEENEASNAEGVA